LVREYRIRLVKTPKGSLVSADSLGASNCAAGNGSER